MTVMAKYYEPEGMRYASLDERKEFYISEFNLQRVSEWLAGHSGKVKFAVIMGRHTKIYLPKYREDASTTIIVDEYGSMEDVRAQILDFLPEAVYYDRNVYSEDDRPVGQELAFDLDPENITCPIHGTLQDKMSRGQGLSFCAVELQMVQREAMWLFDYLEDRFADVRAVYSGRGFHLHVLDKRAYQLTTLQRQQLAAEVKKEGFHIDEWVTAGEMRLIRLPFSLNGLVSRIALPLTKTELQTFDPIHDPRVLPSFLGKSTF